MKIDALELNFHQLNNKIKECQDEKIKIVNCCGHRYLASGSSSKIIEIEGVPGNALGCYLDGSEIFVNNNVQDATGDTMNDGGIYIYGMAGDATGYAMRGGEILIHGDIGYRAGIHMKEYQDKKPVIVVGGTAGSFLGEYQAGGIIVVLGLNCENKIPVGNFCGVGMHGGKIFLRSDVRPKNLSDKVVCKIADEGDLNDIKDIINKFCNIFNESYEQVMSKSFYVITPNSNSPYKQLYTMN